MKKPITLSPIARRIVPVVLCAALPGLGGPQGVQVDPRVWTATGPEGARVTALAIDPRKPRILYAGTGAGVFKSTDHGRCWERASSVHAGTTALAIDPRTPTTIYEGTGSLGVLKSTDGGETWRAVTTGLTSEYGLLEINALVIDPGDSDTLYAGTGGPFSMLGRVLKSADGGETWSKVSGTSLEWSTSAVLDLVIDPQAPATLYAAARGGRWSPDTVFKSTDGGAFWIPAGSGLPARLPEAPGASIRLLEIDPRQPATLYAGTREGVFKTTDGGGSWRAARTGLSRESSGSLQYPGILGLAIDPRDPQRLYASVDTLGLFRSTDGGGRWVPFDAGAIPLPVGEIALDPADPETLYVAAGHGVYRTTDGGSGWSDAGRGIGGGNIVALATDPLTPGRILAGKGTVLLQDFGLFKSDDRGETWSPGAGFPRGVRVEVLAADPQSPATLYAGAWGAGLLKSTDGGATWSPLAWPHTDVVLTIAIDALTPTTLYVGTSHLGIHKSVDGGATWHERNAGLPPGSRHITALLIDPRDPATLYAGSYDAGVFKSTDAGAGWSPVNTGLTFSHGTLQWTQSVASLAIDPRTPTTLYAGTLAYIGLPREDGGVFKSHDGGLTWTQVNTGLETEDRRYVYALVVDPRSPSILYAGTHEGIFRSTDGGGSWSIFASGLQGLIVDALALDSLPPGALYAGTRGGGVFILSPVPAPVDIVDPAGAAGDAAGAGSIGTAGSGAPGPPTRGWNRYE